MSYTNIHIHCVWTTKNRNPILSKTIRPLLFNHMRFQARDKGIYLDRINGYLDHVHCLIQLKPGQSIDHIMKLMKGGSAYWYNKHMRPLPHTPKLEWQREYYAISVSESVIQRTRAYIDRQEIHHQHKRFDQELAELQQLTRTTHWPKR